MKRNFTSPGSGRNERFDRVAGAGAGQGQPGPQQQGRNPCGIPSWLLRAVRRSCCCGVAARCWSVLLQYVDEQESHPLGQAAAAGRKIRQCHFSVLVPVPALLGSSEKRQKLEESSPSCRFSELHHVQPSGSGRIRVPQSRPPPEGHQVG